MRNVPRRFGCLKTYFPVGGAVCGGYGTFRRWSFAGGSTTGITASLPDFQFALSVPVWMEMWSQLPSLAICCHAFPTIRNSLSGSRSQNILSLKLLLVMVSSHSSRKQLTYQCGCVFQCSVSSMCLDMNMSMYKLQVEKMCLLQSHTGLQCYSVHVELSVSLHHWQHTVYQKLIDQKV